jgi:carbon monoxide dehydrogenase subunit G
MTIRSDKKNINGSVEKVYEKISNISNLSPFVGDKVQDWKATEDECSFTVNAMGVNAVIALRITEKIPCELIRIQSGDGAGQGGSPFPFVAAIHLQKIDDTSFYANADIDVEVPAMLSMMVKKPLQQAIDKLMEQLANMAAATV